MGEAAVLLSIIYVSVRDRNLDPTIYIEQRELVGNY
jgi:hypothetical protein